MGSSKRTGKAHLSDLEWEMYPDPHGRPTSPVQIIAPDNPNVLNVQFPPGFEAGEHWHPFDTFYYMTKGSLRFGDEGVFGPGAVRWVKAGHAYGPEAAGPEGCEFILISFGGPIGLNWADIDAPPGASSAEGPLTGRALIDDTPWEVFEDPAGRPTSPVKVLSSGVPSALYVKFEPGFSAGEHWHPFDTVYVMTQGALQFGDEGIFGPGDVRWVKAGHSYGPEAAGPEGCEFLLVSAGPIELNWSDLLEPPTLQD